MATEQDKVIIKKSKKTGSSAFRLNKIDMKKIGKGAAIAFVGAGSISLLQYLSQFDFGSYTPYITAIAAVLVNMLNKWASNNNK